MNDVETLYANGYATKDVKVDGDARIQVLGIERYPWFENNVLVRTFTRASAALAVVELSVRFPDDVTPAFTKLRDGLVKLLAPADKLLRKHVRPLVRIAADRVQFVYQTESARVCLGPYPRAPEFENGLRCTDAPNVYATVRLACTNDNVFIDGDWLNDASPLTVSYAALPQWDSEAVTAKLRAFVDARIADGLVTECGPYVHPVEILSNEEQLARQGVSVVPPTPEPARVPYKDPRLEAAFNPDRFTVSGDPELFADAPRETA
ncbi:MAG: hypothetical protein ACLQO1_04445 [Steroidobacteraceae bacterium]